MDDIGRLAQIVKGEEKRYGASALRPELDREARRVKWHKAQRDKLVEMATDRTEAGRIWATESARYPDEGQRLQVFRGVLTDRGLVAPNDARGVDVHYRDPGIIEEAKAQRERLEALEATFSEILEATTDRIEARRLYNVLTGPKSQDKLQSWRRHLVDAKLLPAHWLSHQ